MQILNQDIKDKTFKRVYLLFGDEPFLVNSYKKRLREAIAGDDTMLCQRSLVSRTPCLFLLSGDLC